MSIVRTRPQSSLPRTELSWLKLSDHFIATVGPSSGQGRPLGPLLVLADATFAPRSRFPIHPHRDMEILSVVVDGELSHHGNQAHDAVIKPRAAQLISARNGMVHAEGNDLDRPTRMLQIWFSPNQRGGEAAYFDRQLPTERGRHLVAGDEGMPLRCDARVWWIDLDGKSSIDVQPGRRGYLIALEGPVRAGESVLKTGDGAEIDAGELALDSEGKGAVLYIDIPA